MVTSLTEVAQEVRVEIDEPVWLCKNPSYRFKENPEMAFLEEELFRYSRRKYSGEKMRSISLHEVHTPQEEAQYVAEEIRRLVREEEEAYAKLDTLNLTEEQREVIEEAFEAQSAAEAEYATESYFCGIADCIRFLKYIEGTRSK